MTEESRSRRDGDASYPPIEHHALIGNQYTAALVDRDGAIVWCCFPELADPSVFASVLDHRKGGSFRIDVDNGGVGRQVYDEQSAVLRTSYESGGGSMTVADFMPMRGSIEGCNEPHAEPAIHRLLHCERGQVHVRVRWAPRLDYARQPTRIVRDGERFVAHAGDARLALVGLADGAVDETDDGPEVRASLTLSAGDRVALVTHFGDGAPAATDHERSARRLEETQEAWREWAVKGGSGDAYSWAGAHRALVLRSAIILKMLTHPATGAIAAAPTTSLPETIGGVRNWDYRYTWIRDASFTVQALLALGHAREARDFVEFAEHTAMRTEESEGNGDVKIMYDLHGRIAPEEEELDHFEGYRRSQPVRIGNGARLQKQHDVYGELIDCAYELVRRGESLEPDIMEFLARLADRACDVWEEPDNGIWEFRDDPRHYTYSKLMVWVGLDRAVRMSEHHDLRGDVDRWRTERDRIREEILERGYSRRLGAFVMAYDNEELDAANLRIPLVEFLPCADPRVQGTIDRTLEHLTKNGMVYRYLAEDGLPGHEGTFGLCTFWMIDALALSGRLDQARAMFEGMVARANHVGLYAEEISATSGAFLGNFPQAFTHIGLINSTLYLAAAEGSEHPMVANLEGAPSMCGAPGPSRAG